jgi:hypothetical protein
MTTKKMSPCIATCPIGGKEENHPWMNTSALEIVKKNKNTHLRR